MSVVTALADGVLELVLDRPEKRNALTRAMYGALADGLERAGSDAAVRCVLLRGNGAGFCAGNDIADFQETRPAEGISHATRFLRAISSLDKPIVAAVQGNAVGVGTTMLLHCDLVLAAEDAMLSVPFAQLGLVPEAASSLLLPRMIGPRRAQRMFLLGERVPAATAADWGLVGEVVAGEALLATARAQAAKLAAMPPEALALTKRLARGDLASIHARMAEEGALFGERLRSAEAREAFAAFMEKRTPAFR